MLINTNNIFEFMEKQDLPYYITKHLIQWNNLYDYFDYEKK